VAVSYLELRPAPDFATFIPALRPFPDADLDDP
jgi:hypothetical protein